MPHINDSRRDLYFAFGQPVYPRMLLSREISLIEDHKTFLPPPTIPPLKRRVPIEYPPCRRREDSFESGKQVLSDPYRDWKGIGRDALYFVGYQAVVAGVLYLLPESVTKWTDEQKRTTVNKWAENVQSAAWDSDHAWINYLGHPYWGATYYIRAQRARFGRVRLILVLSVSLRAV